MNKKVNKNIFYFLNISFLIEVIISLFIFVFFNHIKKINVSS